MKHHVALASPLPASSRVVSLSSSRALSARLQFPLLCYNLVILLLLCTILFLLLYGNPPALTPCSLHLHSFNADGRLKAGEQKSSPLAASPCLSASPFMRSLDTSSSSPPTTSDQPCSCPPSPPAVSLPAADCPKIAAEKGGGGREEEEEGEGSEKRLILITPTYFRATQRVHMLRVTTLLRHIPPPLLWIVVEMPSRTTETHRLLQRLAKRCIRVGRLKKCQTIEFVHISTKKVQHLSRGVEQRNAALRYIQRHKIKGLVYFMDDDNAYDPMLFEELRKTQRIGILPVGFMWNVDYIRNNPQKQMEPAIERPLVTRMKNGKYRVFGWDSFEWSIGKPYNVKRKYHIDMAGFTFDSELMWTPTDNKTGRPVHPVLFTPSVTSTESQFLERLVERPEDFELLADNCQDVYVWHIQFETNNTLYFPHDWRISQVDNHNFVLDRRAVYKISRYVNNHRLRMKLKGFNLTIPFGYETGIETNTYPFSEH